MKLIADSGSTKTDWILLNNGKRVHSTSTQGINPFYQNTSEIANILKTELLPKINHEIPSSVFFYGAGCSFPEKQKQITKAFLDTWNSELKIELQSDLIGAARASLHNTEGIACILGTGANSCHWNGNAIVKNVAPLGYILGDEGSGAVLGKLFIADLLKQLLPKELAATFFKEYNTSYEEIMQKVYKKEFPNRSLAQYCHFIYAHKEVPEIKTLIRSNFQNFIDRNLKQYPQHLPVHFVGSIAFAFSKTLEEMLTQNNIKMGKILKKPIEALAEYHQN